ncbi:MAG: hypothetical protein K6T94_25330 [Paenibacillus sp.]|nr:hypothetical protein [Paenibacillus sp.]
MFFLASLFSADLSQIQDGSIKCPVIVLAGKGDPLFPLEYTQKIFKMIQAPYKEIMMFDVNAHLIFNESLPQVLQPIVKKLNIITEKKGLANEKTMDDLTRDFN